MNQDDLVTTAEAHWRNVIRRRSFLKGVGIATAMLPAGAAAGALCFEDCQILSDRHLGNRKDLAQLGHRGARVLFDHPDDDLASFGGVMVTSCKRN